MATYTNKIGFAKPDAGATAWQNFFYRNQHIIDAITWQKLQGDFVISGGVMSSPSVLNIDVSTIEILVSDVYYSIVGGTKALTDDSTNYLWISSTGVFNVSTSPPSADNFVMVGFVDTESGAITRYKNTLLMLKSNLSTPSGVDLIGGISGLNWSNNTTDSNHDIDISPGSCVDSTGLLPITLNSTITKRLDGAWVEGTNQGGLLNGTIAANTMYYLYLMLKSDGTVDVAFLKHNQSISVNAPTGYNYYRRIGFVNTDNSSNIRSFSLNNGVLVFDTGFEIITSFASTSYTLHDISDYVPTGTNRIRIAVASMGSTFVISLSGVQDEIQIPSAFGGSVDWSVDEQIPILEDRSFYGKLFNTTSTDIYIKQINFIR